MESTLAFRLYGNFYWPPKAEAPPHDQTTLAAPPAAEGVVEIHYEPSQDPADTSRRPYLRWRPKATLGSAPPEPPSDHLFNSKAAATSMRALFRSRRSTISRRESPIGC